MQMVFELCTIGPRSSVLVATAVNISSINRLVNKEKTKIEEAQAKLHNLQLKKKNLEEHHYEATRLRAPIRRLPHEILARVLLFVIPDVFKWNDPQHRIGTVDLLEDVDIESLYLARLHLLRVCHRWKRAVYECPAAWTSIIVDSEVPLHNTQHSLQ
ncbi:hypothetical protein M422DRAFT_262380 [Sphaerobolus stellatus SS14]|uniref:Unplaced genomic scaffold SPHSTscaffold_114, whole genome shotgun sequence n=1 Tax=Sphaerobolus stellatus (strain SS14) TaxID=990650 RepID=A0A0C9VD18_SPHS4|nr:hypothetical protein M422DRAFT_262380 [Sphaerobolus stellatus SS14]